MNMWFYQLHPFLGQLSTIICPLILFCYSYISILILQWTSTDNISYRYFIQALTTNIWALLSFYRIKHCCTNSSFYFLCHLFFCYQQILTLESIFRWCFSFIVNGFTVDWISKSLWAQPFHFRVIHRCLQFCLVIFESFI